MKVRKNIHHMWIELDNFLNRFDLKQSERDLITKMRDNVGKYQWIYESEKGKISLISFHNHFFEGCDIWEIYCLEGNLFDDIMRFIDKENAIKQIEAFLE